MGSLVGVLAKRKWPVQPSLYYPCAGQDWLAVVEELGQRCDVLKFCDLRYRFSAPPKVLPTDWKMEPDSWRLEGPALSEVRSSLVEGRRVSHVAPATARVGLRHQRTNKLVEVQLRRGFGQYGLHEIEDGTLDLFLHRGDSPGEGGSNVWFFSNWRARHPPLSSLFNVIKKKLRYPAVIGSDGSDCEIRELRLAASSVETPADFTSHGLHWRHLCRLPDHGRTTSLWQVEPA